MKQALLLLLCIAALLAAGCSKSLTDPTSSRLGASGTPSEIEEPGDPPGDPPPPTVIMKWQDLQGPDQNGYYTVNIVTTVAASMRLS